MTIASWCSVPSAPRRLVGAISPTYIGVKPDTNPTQWKKYGSDRHLWRTWCSELFRFNAVILRERWSTHHSKHQWWSVPGSSFQRSGRSWTTPSDSRQWRQTNCLWACLSSWENNIYLSSKRGAFLNWILYVLENNLFFWSLKFKFQSPFHTEN